ncbi:helix-turn-helix domain-containing protein [Nonomuraea sediminis]|uniref:helix-turn-helix domain-containing protein n=1 Tax=Nonomuraea sediminis TaxID=2835864 RepID=UPI0027DFF557|nr:helix-turn-helix domain-containing protein [Nonomuraea sediminis]
MEMRKHARVSGAERETLKAALKRRYSSGESIRALSVSTGRSYGFVHRLLEEAGVPLRPRGGNQRLARSS